MITKLIGMVDSAKSPLHAHTGTDPLVENNGTSPTQNSSMENEGMTDMTASGHEEMIETTDDMIPDSVLPDMELSARDHQADETAVMEQPAISDLVAAADGFNAAFNVALYELDASRKQLVEHAIRVEELNESIKTLNSALSNEVDKGHRREQEYSQDKELMHQRIRDIESTRDQLLLQISEQESTLNARDAEISQLSSRVNELTGALDQRTAEGQRAAEEISHLTTRIEELSGALHQRTAEAQHAQEEFARETNELTGKLDDLKVRLDDADGQVKAQCKELDDRDEEINGLSRQAESLIADLDSVMKESDQQEKDHNQETARLSKEIENLNEGLQSREMLLEQRTSELDLKNKEVSWQNEHINELKDEIEAKSASIRAQSESHASVCEELNAQINSISGELESLRAVYGELEVHAEKLENLNRALHESSVSENSLHKKALEDKAREIGLLRTKLDAANESLQGDPEKITAIDKLQLALNTLETRLKEAEAQREVYSERAQLASDLEAEVEQLRSELAAAGDTASQSSVDTDALQSRVADLQAALESSEARQKALVDQLSDHEVLEQEVIKLREAVQQADSGLLEQADASATVDALKEEADKLRAALSVSEEKCTHLQTALSSSSLPDSTVTQGMSLVQQDSQPVTEAFDRNRFLSHLNNLLTVPGNAEIKQTVMYILLDNFVQIRDEIGIVNSEQVINGILELITSHCDTDDIITRFGDCTFAVLSSNESTEVTHKKADIIRSTIESYIFESAGGSLITTASIGICSVRKSDGSAEEVMSRADLACEAVRLSGGNGVLVSSALADEMLTRGSNEGNNEIVSRILSENRIEIYYQPISALSTVTGSYFEVLTRIVDEDGNMILPGEFFAMAESSGQTVDIDRSIIENIMKMMAENPHQDMTLFIKLTGQSVADHELPIWIIRKIKEYKINPEQLVFEVAENTLQSDIKNVSALSRALNSIGCKIAIEHYRMSTQAQHLKHIHADYLKIDRGLVESIGRKGNSLAKVTAIMAMAREHNYMTIAEGVESPASLAILWELGVHYAQGYFIQAPSGKRDYEFHDATPDEDLQDCNRATFTVE
ncbi:MAG: EAL domain-containing protein [Gammaproteobacteria bacterium]